MGWWSWLVVAVFLAPMQHEASRLALDDSADMFDDIAAMLEVHGRLQINFWDATHIAPQVQALRWEISRVVRKVKALTGELPSFLEFDSSDARFSEGLYEQRRGLDFLGAIISGFSSCSDEAPDHCTWADPKMASVECTKWPDCGGFVCQAPNGTCQARGKFASWEAASSLLSYRKRTGTELMSNHHSNYNQQPSPQSAGPEDNMLSAHPAEWLAAQSLVVAPTVPPAPSNSSKVNAPNRGGSSKGVTSGYDPELAWMTDQPMVLQQSNTSTQNNTQLVNYKGSALDSVSLQAQEKDKFKDPVFPKSELPWGSVPAAAISPLPVPVGSLQGFNYSARNETEGAATPTPESSPTAKKWSPKRIEPFVNPDLEDVGDLFKKKYLAKQEEKDKVNDIFKDLTDCERDAKYMRSALKDFNDMFMGRMAGSSKSKPRGAENP